MPSPELLPLPCPFCKEYLHYDGNVDGFRHPAKYGCPLSSQLFRDIEAWNRRAPSAEREWQDISTAPKDGTEILVFDSTEAVREGDYCYIARWSAASLAWVSNVRSEDELDPTHWMPKPSPPKGERREG